MTPVRFVAFVLVVAACDVPAGSGVDVDGVGACADACVDTDAADRLDALEHRVAVLEAAEGVLPEVAPPWWTPLAVDPATS